jgi:hypothetical protein
MTTAILLHLAPRFQTHPAETRNPRVFRQMQARAHVIPRISKLTALRLAARVNPRRREETGATRTNPARAPSQECGRQEGGGGGGGEEGCGGGGLREGSRRKEMELGGGGIGVDLAHVTVDCGLEIERSGVVGPWVYGARIGGPGPSNGAGMA